MEISEAISALIVWPQSTRLLSEWPGSMGDDLFFKPNVGVGPEVGAGCRAVAGNRAVQKDLSGPTARNRSPVESIVNYLRELDPTFASPSAGSTTRNVLRFSIPYGENQVPPRYSQSATFHVPFSRTQIT